MHHELTAAGVTCIYRTVLPHVHGPLLKSGGGLLGTLSPGLVTPSLPAVCYMEVLRESSYAGPSPCCLLLYLVLDAYRDMLLPGQVPPVTPDKLSMADSIDADGIQPDGMVSENGTPDTNGKVHILTI